MANPKTYHVFNKDYKIRRSVTTFREILVVEKKQAKIREQLKHELEDTENEMSDLRLMEIEEQLFSLRLNYLSSLLDIPTTKLENQDPKDINDFYNVVYYYLSTREDQNEELNDPEKALKSMTRFGK